MDSRTCPGVYRGLVVDNSDPESLGRIRVQVPQLFGDAVTNWVWPSFPTGSARTAPAINSLVWVAFEAGDPEHPVWLGTM